MRQRKNTTGNAASRHAADLGATVSSNEAEIDRMPHQVRAPLADLAAPVESVPEELPALPVERQPDSPLERAEQLVRRGDVAAALGHLERALEEQPDDVRLLCARAGAQMARQRYDAAEADLRRAAKLDPDSPDVLFGLGTLFCKKARWREAIAPLERAAELAPQNAAGHYYLGEAYNQTDQLKLAMAAYEEAVKLQPGNWRALKGVGIVLDKLGRPAEATVAYQRAREAQRR
jgi:Tfp pilus assembly protein PilF